MGLTADFQLIHVCGQILHRKTNSLWLCQSVCFYECLSLLPLQYHMKRKKVYNLFVFKSGQREISSWLGNINSFTSVLRESLRFGGRKRLFRCSQPMSHHPPACFLGNVNVNPPTTLVATPQKYPISCGALASSACASVRRQKPFFLELAGLSGIRCT